MYKYIEQYLQSCKLKNYAVSTINVKKYYLYRFQKYVQTKFPQDVQKKHIENFLDTISGNPLNFNKYLSSIHEFYKYLIRNKIIFSDPSFSILHKKEYGTLPRNILSETDISKLIYHTKNPTERFLIEMLYVTGMRISELVRLEISDINISEKTIHIRETKNREDRITPFGKSLNIKRYIKTDRPQSLSTKLLIRQDGKPLTVSSAGKFMIRLSRNSGFKKTICLHSLRHTFAVHMLRNGADIFAISKMLGHKKISTTQIYTRIQNTELKRVHSLSHPRDKFNSPTISEIRTSAPQGK